MDTLPKMFLGAAIQRVHAMQYTGHMDARLAAPHTDCGIKHLLRELEFRVDGMCFEQSLHVQFSGGMVS